ncbi:DUF4272 domain-containing protein [Massilia sp. PAMC28688]|uniref:DUF4272 domain-containing protein n=1 Tax=Massilia sp. PAMC28688 TaxID=2861283 RepID=UPI001C6379A2|nr:DUF4272 domain-containing protein [Massilia sp. PAMC28688]QYF93624.1 DUF4272 domain-containing protein [Massilia sp. PAMC28688]
MLDPDNVKRSSEVIIRQMGGEVLDHLPTIGTEEISLRPCAEIAERALILHVLVALSFGMPREMGRDWLSKHGLTAQLSREERTTLEGKGPVDEADRNYLRWNIEYLYTSLWAGSLVASLDPVQDIPDTLASTLPDLKTCESPDRFLTQFALRPLPDLYAQLDLFYRAHWYAKNCSLTGRDVGDFHPGVVETRRKMLEWLMNSESDWDNVELST